MPNVVAGQAGRQNTWGKTTSGGKVNWDPNSANFIGTVNYINPNAFQVIAAGTCATTGSASGNYQTTTNQAYYVCNGPADYVPGNTARTAALNIWGQRAVNVDMSLRRTFPIYREWKVAFGIDMTNIANHVVYAGPSASVSANTPVNSFGVVSKVANQPRDVQGSLRISF
jgi:hypothetical protein